MYETMYLSYENLGIHEDTIQDERLLPNGWYWRRIEPPGMLHGPYKTRHAADKAAEREGQ